MTWKAHLQKVKSKIASGCWALYRLKNYVNQHTLRMVYFGLIYSNLKYCISCWGHTSQCHLQPLNVLNKRAIRTICNTTRNAHTTPLFADLKILKLEDLFSYQIGIIMHQISSKTFKGSYCIQSVKDIHNYSTRFSTNSNYYRQSINLKSTDRALSIIGPKIWSQIPVEIKTLQINEFKIAYRQFLVDKYKQS